MDFIQHLKYQQISLSRRSSQLIKLKPAMRCVSKCFIGGKSFRVYSLLILGMVFGFSLSTIIQTFNADSFRNSALERVQEPLHSHETRQGSKVAFSNLRKDVQEEEEPSQELGDYRYEREPDGAKRASREPEMGGAAGHRKFAVPMAANSLPPSVLTSPEGVQLKMRGYESESWQGRKVRETAKKGEVPNMLSDELSTRQTLLVAVITSVIQLMSQTLSIQGTWATQDTHVVYFVGAVNVMPHLPRGMAVIELADVDDHVNNWELKEISAVKYLMDHYLDKADWFMITGDMTYVAVDRLEKRLNALDASFPVYMGHVREDEEAESNEENLLCEREPGVVYSRAMLEGLRPYLPTCWPGGQGEGKSLGGCVAVMGVKCTQAREVSPISSLN